MKVLIITERVDKDHELFGFFHSRLMDFVKECEKVTIICLEERGHNLPKDIVIHSLGKEIRRSRMRYLWNFFRYIWSERKNYDRVFVHLTPLYVVLGGPLWRLLGKDVTLWYNHPFTDFTLRVAYLFANTVITTSKHRLGISGPKVKDMDEKVDLEAYLSHIQEGK